MLPDSVSSRPPPVNRSTLATSPFTAWPASRRSTLWAGSRVPLRRRRMSTSERRCGSQPPHLPTSPHTSRISPSLPTSPHISRPQMRKADPYLPTSPRMCVLGPPGGSRHLPLDSAGLRRVQLKPQPVPPRACCGHSPRLFGMPQAPARLTISPPLSPSLPRYLSAEVDPIQAFAAPVFGHRDIAEIDAEIKPRYVPRYSRHRTVVWPQELRSRPPGAVTE